MNTYNILYRYHTLYGGNNRYRTNAKRIKATTQQKAIAKSGINKEHIREVWVRVYSKSEEAN